METLARKKISLRKEFKQKLKSLAMEQKRFLDHAVFKNLVSMPEFQRASCFYGYMALSWETGTSEIIEYLLEKNIPVALPRVLGDDMEFFQINSMSDLQEGAFHILEPKESCKMVRWPDACMLIPGLAFSLSGKRLGKGGGYYDKFLNREPGHDTIALAYEFQICGDIPSEEHDRSVDYLVTEENIYKSNTCESEE